MNKHKAYLVNGKLSSLLLLKMHEAIALALASSIHRDFAGQDVAKGTEGVVQSLVVDALVQILDEDISHTGLAEGWITVRPHDAQRLAIQRCVVQLLQSSLSCRMNPLLQLTQNSTASNEAPRRYSLYACHVLLSLQIGLTSLCATGTSGLSAIAMLQLWLISESVVRQHFLSNVGEPWCKIL